MKFVSNIKKNEYDEYWLNNINKSHFLQSSLWGKLKSLNNLTPHFVGIKENNKLVLATLLLQKKLPFGYSYFYGPRALTIEINEDKYLSFFTSSIKEYIKKEKGIFLKIDPAIIINDSNKDNYLKLFTNNKYKHLGFTQNFETAQPRFTYRIDLGPPIDEIINNFDVTAKQRYRKALKYKVESNVGNKTNINDFVNLIKMTENRKGFYSHPSIYYNDIYNVFKDNLKVFIATINPKNIINDIKEEIDNINNEINLLNSDSKKTNNLRKELKIKLDSLSKDYENFNKLSLKYNGDVVVSSYIIVYYLDKAWVLYGANHDEFLFTNANYHLYYYHIKYAKDFGVSTYDLFGCVGPNSNDKYLRGLNDFKSKFGGTYIEFIGEFDLVVNKYLYFVFTKIIPIYRKLINILIKLKNKGASNNE